MRRIVDAIATTKQLMAFIDRMAIASPNIEQSHTTKDQDNASIPDSTDI